MPQHWIGSTDTNFMLTQIGGWHVGCYNAEEAAPAIAWAESHGYIGRRIHHAPAFPDGVAAYELTDEGLAYLRQVEGEKAFKTAGKMRKWYRDREKARARLGQ